MKYLFNLFQIISIFAVFTFAVAINAQSECNLQYSLDEVVNNITNYVNQNIVVAGQVDRILVDKGETPGFVIKSVNGSELYTLGGMVAKDENGEKLWRIMTDIYDVDPYGEEIIALAFIDVYPGDYVALCGDINITGTKVVPYALELWNVEVIEPGYVKKVKTYQDFNIQIEKAINPYFDWVVSEHQGDFYFEKIKYLGSENVSPENNFVGVTTKSFLFKAVENGFTTIRFDYFDSSDQNRPKRIDRKEYLIFIE